MAWMTKNKNGKALTDLADAFGRQNNNVGHMPAPAMALHQKTMATTKPLGSSRGATFGTSAGLPPTPSAGKSVQSSAQHAAVEKAAKVSAGKRRKF